MKSVDPSYATVPEVAAPSPPDEGDERGKHQQNAQASRLPVAAHETPLHRHERPDGGVCLSEASPHAPLPPKRQQTIHGPTYDPGLRRCWLRGGVPLGRIGAWVSRASCIVQVEPSPHVAPMQHQSTCVRPGEQGHRPRPKRQPPDKQTLGVGKHRHRSRGHARPPDQPSARHEQRDPERAPRQGLREQTGEVRGTPEPKHHPPSVRQARPPGVSRHHGLPPEPRAECKEHHVDRMEQSMGEREADQPGRPNGEGQIGPQAHRGLVAAPDDVKRPKRQSEGTRPPDWGHARPKCPDPRLGPHARPRRKQQKEDRPSDLQGRSRRGRSWAHGMPLVAEQGKIAHRSLPVWEERLDGLAPRRCPRHRGLHHSPNGERGRCPRKGTPTAVLLHYGFRAARGRFAARSCTAYGSGS